MGRTERLVGIDANTLVSRSDISNVELVVVRRMQEFTLGTHQSMFHGSGHDVAGTRDWQPGDRLSNIDWAQSTLTNFSPVVAREFDQESTAQVVIAADVSASTQCGIANEPIAKVVAMAVATFAMAASFFQDSVGLITFNRDTREIALPPKVGRNHAIHCVEAYQEHLLRKTLEGSGPKQNFDGLLRKRSLVPIVSDFLLEDPDLLLTELADLNTAHDVFLVMIDSAFAFEFPNLSAGWVEGYDVETGRNQVISSTDLHQIPDRVRGWQNAIEQTANDRGLEIVRLDRGQQFYDTLVSFLLNRKQMRRQT